MVFSQDIKPSGNHKPSLEFSRFRSIRAVNHVVAHVHAEVATDGAWVGVSAVGGADEFASDGYGFNTLPSHANDGTGGHEFDEAGEEGAFLVDIVV